MKVDVLFNLIDEIHKKIQFNLDKWQSGLVKVNFISVIKQQFNFENILENAEIDTSCFIHDTKIPQIMLTLTHQDQKI
jgi:hypothetical protein